METILRVIFIVGVIQSLIAYVWFLIIAFREGLGHGLLMFFFLEIYAFIFSILHWDEAKKPFFSLLIGGILMLGSVLLKPMLATGNAFPDDPKTASGQAASSEFKRKLATAIASQIAANIKRGSTKTPAAFPAHPATGSPPISQPTMVQTADSKAVANAPTLKKSLLAFVTQDSTKTAPPPTTNEWDWARSLLRVGGVMQTGTQLFATVNQQVVKVNDHVAVDLNGRLYRFKVRRIDLRTNTVQFDPIEP